MYDTKSNRRRPVLCLEWPDEAFTAISSTPCEHEVLVGTAAGHIAQYDIRMTHKGMRRKYRGCTGSIRSIDCHPQHKCFGVVGLDRFLRIYDIDQPKPIQRMYLKSKLNHVLLNRDFDPNTAIVDKKEELKKKRKKAPKKDDDVREDGDEFWAKLPVIRGNNSKRGYKNADAPLNKKAKK